VIERELSPAEKTAVAACRYWLSGNEAARQRARVYLKVKLFSLDESSLSSRWRGLGWGKDQGGIARSQQIYNLFSPAALRA